MGNFCWAKLTTQEGGMKHNQQIVNAHFRKEWEKHVSTWFDQPANKLRRRNARITKAKKVAPRPINLLCPAVRCPTVKYNMRVRAGRGFTLAEIKAAGFNAKSCRGLGVAVDNRRTNRSEESFQANVQRLKLYKSKLVVFPRKTAKRVKRGDSSAEACASAVQVLTKQTLPIEQPNPRIKARKITADEKNAQVNALVKKLRTDAKLWGAREKRAASKEAAAAAGGKK